MIFFQENLVIRQKYCSCIMIPDGVININALSGNIGVILHGSGLT